MTLDEFVGVALLDGESEYVPVGLNDVDKVTVCADDTE